MVEWVVSAMGVVMAAAWMRVVGRTTRTKANKCFIL